MHTEGTEGAREGRLQLIDNQVDAKSGTIRLRAIFANRDGSLIPGQFARIRMGQPATTKAVLVADRVVGTDQDKKFVWVVDARNQAVYREVTLGAAVDGQRVVTAGLQAGERIVVNGLQRVRPGALLQPQVAAAAAPAAAGTAAPTPTAAAKPAGTAPAGTTTSGTGAAQADAPAKART
jgi:multidrug efflux system membrane fusion protein